jgi:hypothetical protein
MRSLNEGTKLQRHGGDSDFAGLLERKVPNFDFYNDFKDVLDM